MSEHRDATTMLDPSTWQVALDSYAHVTGITATLYAVDGTPLVGPLVASPFAEFLESHAAFAPDGVAAGVDRTLVARAIATRDAVSHHIENSVVVSALPFFADGQGIAALVFGWVFEGYSDPLECERLGRAFGVPGHALWTVVRRQRPTSAASFAKATALLRTMVDASLTQLATVAHLRSLSQVRERFLARVSHELRTPLQSIVARADLLLRTLETNPAIDVATVTAELGALKQSALRETQLVEDLLDVSRTMTGRLSVRRERVVLRDVLSDAVQQARPIADAARVSLVREGDADVAVEGDALRLCQVAQNLVGNAIRASEPGGNVRVVLHVSREATGFDVRDDGKGIEPVVLARIFDPFVQGEASADRRSGLGLGLTIARHIVEAHGGRLSASSDGLGKGATFSVRLPRVA